MYNVGLVGCGVIGNRLAESFAEHEGTTVWGACDLVESKVETFAAEYDCESFTDYETLIDRDELDVVYVGVPPAHHYEIVAYALETETHVICEKPIAEDAERGAEMVTLASESDQTTAINLPFRYTSGFAEMRDRVESGYVGDPKRIELRFRFPQWPRDWQDVDWLAGREQGGPLREVGTHFLFGVQEMFGPIETVNAEVSYRGPEKYEESIVGYFEADGIYGTIDLVTDHDEPEENSITVLGSESSLSLRKWYELVESPGSETKTVLNDTRESTTLELVDEFVTTLNGNDGDLVSFAEANRVQRVVDAIFDSSGVSQSL